MSNHTDRAVEDRWIGKPFLGTGARGARSRFLLAVCATTAVSCGVSAQGGGGANTGSAVVVVVTTGASTGGTGSASGTASTGTASGGSTASGAAQAGGTSGAASSGSVTSGMASTGAAASGAAMSGTASTGGGSGTATSGAPSGISIVIGTATVPKEKVVAFIHFGHSNMAGRGDSPMTSRPYFFMQPDPHGWMFHTNNGFQPADEPLTAGDSGNTMALIPGQTLPLGGPGTALIKQAIALAPDYYFVSLGHGVGTAYCSQFLPGHLYYNAVMAAPMALKGKVTFGAIVVMLGITERHGTQADITGYPNCINTLVTQIRTDLGEPNLPLLLSDYEMGATGALAPTSAFAMQIIPQIHMVPSVVSNSVIVPTDNITMLPPPDDHHFNLEGHRTYTQRVLSIMQQKGWFPWQ